MVGARGDRDREGEEAIGREIEKSKCWEKYSSYPFK